MTPSGLIHAYQADVVHKLQVRLVVRLEAPVAFLKVRVEMLGMGVGVGVGEQSVYGMIMRRSLTGSWRRGVWIVLHPYSACSLTD